MPHYIFPKGMPGKETAPLTEAKQEGPRRPSPHEGDPKVQIGGGTCLARLHSRLVAGPRRKPGLLAQPRALSPGHPALFPITVCAVSSPMIPCPPNKIKSDPLMKLTEPHGSSAPTAADGIWAIGGGWRSSQEAAGCGSQPPGRAPLPSPAWCRALCTGLHGCGPPRPRVAPGR